jgi:hypothetical protein
VTAPTGARVRRHPIRGAIAGLLLGLGIAGLLMSLSVIALGTLTPLVVIVCCIVFGVVFAYVVPPLGRPAAGATPDVPTSGEGPMPE